MNKKILIIMMTVVVSSSFFISCTSRKESAEQEISSEELERLPEDQKESELDKMLAVKRKFRKDNLKQENGGLTSITQIDTDLPGQTKNRPEFSTEELEKIDKVVVAYICQKLNIDINDENKVNELDRSWCIDPRINAIYDDENKGIAKAYDNKDIYIEEYEDEKGSYKFLFLGKNSTTGEWEILHDGLTYKN